MTAVHGWGLLLRPHRLPSAVAYRLRRAVDISPPRASDPYGTHVPVLVGLARLLTVRRVLEFGCGRHSTLTFLDRAAFPDLVELDSYETDPVWLEELHAATGTDARVRMHLVEGRMASAVATMGLDRYDLVLIDDSTDELSRAATIAEVAAHASRSTVVVIHDFEVARYRKAASALGHRTAFTALNPHTGVCWVDAPIDRSCLKRLNAFVARHAQRLQPHDRAGWVRLLEEGPRGN